ncbi:MAG TPA: hypothetical protein VK901_21345 [Nitrospiraceae bacterium]|nr:hypothetical protein [Nitrospiraceae bacterium]
MKTQHSSSPINKAGDNIGERMARGQGWAQVDRLYQAGQLNHRGQPPAFPPPTGLSRQVLRISDQYCRGLVGGEIKHTQQIEVEFVKSTRSL